MKRLSGNTGMDEVAYNMLQESYFLGSMSDLLIKLKFNLKNLEQIEDYAHQLTEQELKDEIKKYLDDLQGEYDEFTSKLNQLRNSL